MPQSSLPDEELLRRAVKVATGPHLLPRWSHVGAIFGLGSNSARELCRRFGVDPDEHVGDDWPAEEI